MTNCQFSNTGTALGPRGGPCASAQEDVSPSLCLARIRWGLHLLPLPSPAGRPGQVWVSSSPFHPFRPRWSHEGNGGQVEAGSLWERLQSWRRPCRPRLRSSKFTQVHNHHKCKELRVRTSASPHRRHGLCAGSIKKLQSSISIAYVAQYLGSDHLNIFW